MFSKYFLNDLFMFFYESNLCFFNDLIVRVNFTYVFYVSLMFFLMFFVFFNDFSCFCKVFSMAAMVFDNNFAQTSLCHCRVGTWSFKFLCKIYVFVMIF